MSDKRRISPIFLKIILVAGAVILILVVIAISKEISQKRQIQSEIDSLKAEAEKINKDNSSIADKIAYLESNDYKEIQAKDKLNLQSPDEQVVIVKPGMSKEPVADPTAVSAVQPRADTVASYLKWWDYFFKY